MANFLSLDTFCLHMQLLSQELTFWASVVTIKHYLNIIS